MPNCTDIEEDTLIRRGLDLEESGQQNCELAVKLATLCETLGDRLDRAIETIAKTQRHLEERDKQIERLEAQLRGRAS